MAGFAAPPFLPILTDAGGGPTFTMLGTIASPVCPASQVVALARPPAFAQLRNVLRELLLS
jgi:anthranilate phosphoribosyltransferase